MLMNDGNNDIQNSTRKKNVNRYGYYRSGIQHQQQQHQQKEEEMFRVSFNIEWNRQREFTCSTVPSLETAYHHGFPVNSIDDKIFIA